jgi:hypothetical protein
MVPNSFGFNAQTRTPNSPKKGPVGDTSFGGVVLILERIVPDAFERLKTIVCLGFGSKAEEISGVMHVDWNLQRRRYTYKPTQTSGR